jgi:hypothetical protein
MWAKTSPSSIQRRPHDQAANNTYNDRKNQGEVAMTATREKLTLQWRKTAGDCAAPLAERDEFVECAAVAAAVLVKCIEIQPLQVDPWVAPDPLDVCLECWKVWMGRHDGDLGVQGQKSLRVDGDGMGNADTLGMRRDNEIAEATDAMIDSLRACDRWAIYKISGFRSAWNFPLLDYFTAAQGALQKLEEKLRENIATRSLFG